MAEEMAEERRGIAGDRGGVFMETSTPATMEVGLVTISGRIGSTTSIRDVGLVIILSPVDVRTGSVKEATSISPTDLAGSTLVLQPPSPQPL